MFRFFGQVFNTNHVAHACASGGVVQISFNLLTVLCSVDNVVCVSYVNTAVAAYSRLFGYPGDNTLGFNALFADC